MLRGCLGWSVDSRAVNVDRILCAECGEDVTGITPLEGPRQPCPVCGSLARQFYASADLTVSLAAEAGHVAVVGGAGNVTAAPASVHGVGTVTRNAPYFDHGLRSYPPTNPGDSWLVELINPDTGSVEVSIHESPGEAFRRLAEPFEEDTT